MLRAGDGWRGGEQLYWDGEVGRGSSPRARVFWGIRQAFGWLSSQALRARRGNFLAHRIPVWESWQKALVSHPFETQASNEGHQVTDRAEKPLKIGSKVIPKACKVRVRLARDDTVFNTIGSWEINRVYACPTRVRECRHKVSTRRGRSIMP